MDETTIRWLFGIAITMQTGIIGLLWQQLATHVVECRAYRELVVRIDTNVNSVLAEIGNNELGIRGQLNQQNAKLAQHEFRIGALDRIVKQ